MLRVTELKEYIFVIDTSVCKLIKIHKQNFDSFLQSLRFLQNTVTLGFHKKVVSRNRCPAEKSSLLSGRDNFFPQVFPQFLSGFKMHLLKLKLHVIIILSHLNFERNENLKIKYNVKSNYN